MTLGAVDNKGCGDNAQMLDEDKGWGWHFGLGYCLVGVLFGCWL